MLSNEVMIGIASSILLSSVFVQSTGTKFGVVAVRYHLDPDSKIGSKSMGAICAPAGPIYARDLDRRGDAIAELVAARLRQSGIDSAAPMPDFSDRALPSSYRLVATVTGMSVKACRKAYMTGWLGAKGYWSGTGTLDVTWKVYVVSDQRLVVERSVQVDFEIPKKSLSISDSIGPAVVKSALILFDDATIKSL
jgi:hypothetical protein